jgi:ribosomal protein L12E/L44/L45/RPP1/RPP2
MSGAALDFNANGESEEVTSKSDEPKAFTASEVINLIQKALGSTGAAATSTPAELKGGDALGKEDLKKKPVEVQKENDEEASEPKKLKTLTKSLFKANIDEILEQIQVLYPQCSREQLWKALKDRLNKRFPSLKTVD